MNGAIAELCARMIRPPSNSSMQTTGTIHQSFADQRKLSSSPAMGNFINTLFTAIASLRGRCSLFHHVLSEDQHVDAAPAEGAVRLRRRVDDRLAFEVERGVEDHGHAGRLAERLDQPVIA